MLTGVSVVACWSGSRLKSGILASAPTAAQLATQKEASYAIAINDFANARNIVIHRSFLSFVRWGTVTSIGAYSAKDVPSQLTQWLIKENLPAAAQLLNLTEAQLLARIIQAGDARDQFRQELEQDLLAQYQAELEAHAHYLELRQAQRDAYNNWTPETLETTLDTQQQWLYSVLQWERRKRYTEELINVHRNQQV